MHSIASRVAALTACVASSVAIAQPSLTPPAGPVGETGRFGTRVELSQATAPGDAGAVFKIAQPGSYVLTGDIAVPAGLIGIEIASSEITIDLNGYTIRAATAGSGVGIGIEDPGTASALYENIRIANGALAGLATGVGLRDSAFQTLCRQADIRNLSMLNVGVGIDAEFAHIRECTIEATEVGIDAAFSTVSGCKIRIFGPGSAQVGIRSNYGRVSDTQIDLGFDDTGIVAVGSHIIDCSIIGPTGGLFNTGIELQGECAIDNTYVRTDTGFIATGSGDVIRNSTWFGANAALTGGGAPTLIDNNF